jgi:hypothetical protein
VQRQVLAWLLIGAMMLHELWCGLGKNGGIRIFGWLPVLEVEQNRTRSVVGCWNNGRDSGAEGG